MFKIRFKIINKIIYVLLKIVKIIWNEINFVLFDFSDYGI